MMNDNRMYSNDLKHTPERYELRPQAQEFPMMCVVSLVYVCNAKCPACPYTISDIRDKYRDSLFMSTETFKKIADQCGKYGAYIQLTGGGEPMLHPQAVELMEYAKSLGAKIGLITNGSKFTEEDSTRLLKSQVDMIEFSVDASDAETYAQARAGLDWEQLLVNVDRLVKLRNKLNCKTKIIASAVNQQGIDIYKEEEFWKTRVDHVQLRKFLTWGMGDELKSADAEPYLPPEENIPCPWLFERLNIDTRGQVGLCGYDIAFDTNLGNVHEQSIKEIWLGKDFTTYRNLHLSGKADRIEICRNCADRKYRSWTYNYWEIVKTAEKNKKSDL